MYRPDKPTKTTIVTRKTRIGESIEAKIRRIKNNDEPIKDGVQESYTEREEGVKPSSDPRTDKWDAAIDATTAAANNSLRQREKRLGEKTYDTMDETAQAEFHKKFPKNKHSESWAAKNKGTGGEGGA